VAQHAAPSAQKAQAPDEKFLKESRVYGGLKGGVKARTPAALPAFSVENRSDLQPDATDARKYRSVPPAVAGGFV
jgi:hypothetical protein